MEQNGEISKSDCSTAVASTKIKIGPEVDITRLIKASIEYTEKRINPEAKSDEYYGAAKTTGNEEIASASEKYGVASVTGNYGVANATGESGVASATGCGGVSVATGDYGVANAIAFYGVANATG